tara:strand:- start:135 stop:575 length:441 start_codon:yes stop_codon:yes gene_type:complete
VVRPPNNNSRRRRNNNRRPNGRGNGNMDSSGPSVKVRGSARQVYDKYLLLARDAKSSGDNILSESYFQHAEHYARILIENGKFEINSSSNSKKNEVRKSEQEKKTDNQSNDSVEKVSNENGLDSIETEKVSKSEDLESSAEEIAQN